MNDFIGRMETELSELNTKYNALNAFNSGDKFSELHPTMRSLMLAQEGAMFTYVSVLNARIEFAKKLAEKDAEAQDGEE